MHKFLGLLLVFISFAFPKYVLADWHSDTQGIMGTEVSVTLWHANPQKAKEAIELVMAEMRWVDSTLSPYKPESELSKLNVSASGEAQSLSDELNLLIFKSLHYSQLSGGAFDITFASLAQYYNYREEKKPSDELINEVLPAINFHWLVHDFGAKTLLYKHPKVKIDLGGLAKGWAVDRAIELLKRYGIKHASVSAGGDSRVLGDRRGRPWLIGIKHPRLPNNANDEAVIRLPLMDTAISTSGDYERFFLDQKTGERIHHILNPRTGKSASEVISVTILGDEGVDTDPLSTSVFVLGVKKGLALVNDLPNFDAIIIDIQGKVHYSDGLSAGGA